MVRNLNKNANTDPATEACFITVCDFFQDIKMTVLRCSGKIYCESSTFDQPQKVSSGACGGSGSMRAELSYCIKSEESF